MPGREPQRHSDNRLNQASQITAGLSHRASYVAKFTEEKHLAQPAKPQPPDE